MGYQINSDGSYSNIGYDAKTGQPYVSNPYPASSGFTLQSGETAVSQGTVSELGVNTNYQWVDVVDVNTEGTPIIGQAATWPATDPGYPGYIAVASTGGVSTPEYVPTTSSVDYSSYYDYWWAY